MATQELTSMKLTFQTNVKEKDINVLGNLYEVLKDLTGLKFEGSGAENLNKLGASLKAFNGITIRAGLGKGITNLVSSVNEITEIKDISPYAQNLNNSFKSLADASKHFKDMNIKLSGGSGQAIGDLARTLGDLEKVNDITPYARQIENGFKILSNATKHFEGNSASIRSNIGTPIKSIVDSINSITNVIDIRPHGEKIEQGFAILSRATKTFEGNSASISVNLGRSITGMVDAINKIDTVKDISSKANTIERNFEIIANATNNFSGMNSADYSGISRLVTALTSVSKVKKIDDTVVDNAKKLAQAINILDKETTGGTAKLRQINIAAKNLGVTMKDTERSTNGLGNSFKLLNYAAVAYGISRITSALQNLMGVAYGTVEAYGEVQNTLSFFTQSLGSEAGRTASIIQQYADFGAVDFTEFSDQVAKLNQMYKNYGIASEDAAKMALNFTQLAYDASYALGQNGKDIDLWNQRLTSMSTGNVRSGYYLGLDMSVKALSESFEGLTSGSAKAEKVMAMYNATIEQTTAIQGQLAREFGNSYVQAQVFSNRLNQLKQSIGAALIPAFQTMIQWALVSLKVVERVIDAVVRLFGGAGFELINYEKMIGDISLETGSAASGANDIAKGINNANKAAKELKKTISGIDQVFTINDAKPKDPNAGGAGGSGIIGGPVAGYDWLDALANAENIKMLEDIDKGADAIIETIKKGIPYVVSFGTALLAWKLSKGLLDGLKFISSLEGIAGGLGFDKIAFPVGLGLFIADLKKFKDAVADIIANEANFKNVSQLITSFAGMVGDAMIMMGNTKVGGALKVIQGIGEIVTAIKNMVDTGPNWDDALTIVSGLSNVAIGIGIFMGNWQLVGSGIALQGLVLIIGQIDEVWAAIQSGDWSGVDKGDLFIGVLFIVGGIALAIKKFKDITDVAAAGGGLSKAAKASKDVADATGGVSSTLTTLAKNLGMGIVIMAEIAVIGVLFIGSIWLMGLMLQEVVEAWQPVIDNGGTAALAILLGTGILAGVGAAAFALGSAATGSGGTIPLAIAAGTAMLVLLGINAAVFIVEIAIIGDLLQKVDNAWKPLNGRGEAIAESIAIGTALLIGIGTVAALLGVAAVATVGLLPLAIAAGTGMLVLLGAATLTFVAELAITGDALANQLAPSMARVNEVMPDLTNNMRSFTDFMIEFAGHAVAYTASSAVAGLSGTIDTIVGWFTKDPIKKMADDAKKNEKQFKDLNDTLIRVNPLLNNANSGMQRYMDLLNTLYDNANKASSLGTMPSIGVEFKEFSKGLKDGFKDLDGIKTRNVASIMSALNSIDLNKFKGIGSSIVKSLELGLTSYNINVSGITNKIKNQLTFNATSIGTSTTSSIVKGINGSNANVSTFTRRLQSNLTFSSYSIGTDISRGIERGINGFYPNTRVFTDRLKKGLQVSFQIFSPSRWARDFIGNNIGIGVVDGVNQTDVDFEPFKNDVSKSLYEMVDDIVVAPKFEMPVFDTRSIGSQFDSISSNFDAIVKGQLEFDNDNTERAIDNLNADTVEMFERLIQAVENGSVIKIGDEVIGESANKYNRNNIIKKNTTIGR